MSVVEGPAQISRDDTRRRISLEVNVRGRDIGSFVREAQDVIDKQIKIPPGYYITWGGQFENLQRATQRLLIVVPLALFLIFISRLRHPEPVQSKPMIIVALIAILLNTVISLWLRKAVKDDLNVRSAYMHMVGDAVSAVGVVIAGVVVAFTGASIADPVVSILIGLLILWSSWGILKESVNVLLEGIPEGMDMWSVEQKISGVHGVLAVHDLHVWTVGSGLICCSCHITVEEQSVRSGENVLRAVTKKLKHEFEIAHTTIQIEVAGCEPNDMYCIMKLAGTVESSEHEDHQHEEEEK